MTQQIGNYCAEGLHGTAGDYSDLIVHNTF
jgi:hypothetical protein